MTEPGAVDLIHLEDADGDRCIVRVTGRYEPGVPGGHDILRADVLVHADFVDARLELFILPGDLDDWRQELTDFVPGKSATLGGDRGLMLGIHREEESPSLSLSIHDPDRLSVVLWVQSREGWTGEHLDRLERVRRTWPSEYTEPAS
ncbi:DUF5959 family protein [Streptomyces sp. NPDC000594]|uniref:DUF5959 family protein n=1 Tax=Streptomyces sp. NPDC000594 TaxID=3154261 RepID=UPI003326D2F3